MTALIPADRDRITIAILALGGQGGGVLADWILSLANANGFIAQGTSVPGVAQRTGSTVYYIEMLPRSDAGANHPEPVLALMPVPGDVDIVIASELMEAGRAMVRGFVSADRTTLIGSTHRIYAISEKSALGDGVANADRILEAAERRSAKFVGFDMDVAASASGSVISSVMFGALAGSGALPFPRTLFEDSIRGSGKAIKSNLAGFEAGYTAAKERRETLNAPVQPPDPTSNAGRAMKARIEASLPAVAHPLALEGVRRLMDYQDQAYATLYLDRLERLSRLDDGLDRHRLTRSAARYLALWMAYDDTIRVADLKIRASRAARVAREVQLGEGQLLAVTEYMHPRLREVCDALPARLGRMILASPLLRRLLEPLFSKGRHVRTTGLFWFLSLRMVAGLRAMRRSTLRFVEEQARIEDWLSVAGQAAATDRSMAAEIIETQALIKGYSDTFERGLRHFTMVVDEARQLIGRPDMTDRVRQLRLAALADEEGTALCQALDISSRVTG